MRVEPHRGVATDLPQHRAGPRPGPAGRSTSPRAPAGRSPRRASGTPSRGRGAGGLPARRCRSSPCSSTQSPMPVRRTTSATGSSPGPAPVMTSRGRTDSSTRASARTSASQFLYGRRWPLARTRFSPIPSRPTSLEPCAASGTTWRRSTGKPRYLWISSAETTLSVMMRAALAAARCSIHITGPRVERRHHVLGVAPVEHVVHRQDGRHRRAHRAQGGRAVHQVGAPAAGVEAGGDELAGGPDEAVLAADPRADHLAGEPRQVQAAALRTGEGDEVEPAVDRARSRGRARGCRSPSRPWCRCRTACRRTRVGVSARRDPSRADRRRPGGGPRRGARPPRPPVRRGAR